MNKYRAIKVYRCESCEMTHFKQEKCSCGQEKLQKYDSQGEYNRSKELRLLERCGKIRDLQYQVPFTFLVDNAPQFKYVADFTYFENDYVVEDYKGYDTPVSKLKRKLIEAQYRFKILITGAQGR